MVNKALRIVLYSIFTISLLFVVPFNNIYASVQSTIVPTFTSNTSQWNGHLYITNFSDGTNNQASSTLAFTFDDDYYGVVYFDGYGPSNQHIANYSAVFVAGGYGEYRYSYYQNGVINITNVTVNIVSVVKPQSTVDLTQIITILTAIENDTSSIDNVLDSTLLEIRSILSQLIVSNGYLEDLTQIRQWNIPFESLKFVYQLFAEHTPVDIIDYNYNFNFPLFHINQNENIFTTYLIASRQYYLIWASEYANGFNTDTLNERLQITYNNNTCNVTASSMFNNEYINYKGRNLYITFLYLNAPVSGTYTFKSMIDAYLIPIYLNDVQFKSISTDFALQFGLSNKMLDNIDKIANGTTSSSSAAQSSDSANSQLQQDSNTLFQQEDSFKQDMNSAMQNIDTTFTLNNFGSSFMTSAQWVRTQYETLTNNTPFASLITFSLLVGLALIVVGKVYK